MRFPRFLSDHPIQYRQAMRTGGRRSRLPWLPKYLLRCLPSWRASGSLNSLLSRDSRRRKVYPEHQAGSGRARASEGKKSMTTIVDRSIPNSQCCPEEGKEGADLLCGEGAIDPRQRPRGINTTDIWEQSMHRLYCCRWLRACFSAFLTSGAQTERSP